MSECFKISYVYHHKNNSFFSKIVLYYRGNYTLKDRMNDQKFSHTAEKKNRKNVGYFMLHIKLRLYQKKIISVKNKFVVNSILLTRKQKVRSSQMLTFKFNKKSQF